MWDDVFRILLGFCGGEHRKQLCMRQEKINPVLLMVTNFSPGFVPPSQLGGETDNVVAS